MIQINKITDWLEASGKFQKIKVRVCYYIKSEHVKIYDTVEVEPSDADLAIVEAIKQLTNYHKEPLRHTGKQHRDIVVLSAEIVL